MTTSRPFTLSPRARAQGITRAMAVDRWFEEQGQTCRNCGLTFPRRPHAEYNPSRRGEGNHITIGHVIARAVGGPKARWNLVPLCRDCNFTQGTKFWPHLWGDQPPSQFVEWQQRTGWTP